MQLERTRLVRDADLTRWKPVDVEYGPTSFPVLVPPDCRILEMADVSPLPNPRDRIRASIHEPIGTKPLPEILRAKGKPLRDLSVCITTSDITRPVPYRGEGGILLPLLNLLEEAGIAREHITLLVGTGTHRPSTPEEKVAMFGQDVTTQYRIVDHDCAMFNAYLHGTERPLQAASRDRWQGSDHRQELHRPLGVRIVERRSQTGRPLAQGHDGSQAKCELPVQVYINPLGIFLLGFYRRNPHGRFEFLQDCFHLHHVFSAFRIVIRPDNDGSGFAKSCIV